MPSMAVQQFDNSASNPTILNYVRGLASNDYQHRIPAATQANITDVMNAMWQYSPSRNEFADALVNLIGMQIVRYNTWTNPLAKFKRGLLQYGETIEEVGIGLLTAYAYSAERRELEGSIFGEEPNEVQSRFHKVNRRNYYKLTVNEAQLQRAFQNAGGLSSFVTGLMSQITTSDQVDEFLLMTSLFRQYYDRDGFYKLQVPDLLAAGADSVAAKQFLVTVRELTQRLQFMSRKYNAAKLPVVAQPDQLELFMTPRAQAIIDVQALSAAFNVGLADISARTTIVPEENFNIPGAQAILTTRDFFVVGDQKMEMQQSNNPVALHRNFFYHHWQTISASSFVPAILLTTETGNESITVSTPVTGIGTLTLVGTDGSTITAIDRGDIGLVQGSATVNTTGAPAGWTPDNTGLTFTVTGSTSARTRITQEGYLVVGIDEAATELVVRATATADPTFSSTLTVDVTGPLLQGSVGLSVDEDVSALRNTRVPAVSPSDGAEVGTSLTANRGAWDATPDSFTVQWKRDGVAISGATGDTYTVQAADAGHTVTVTVTAVKGTSTVSATSRGVVLPA